MPGPNPIAELSDVSVVRGGVVVLDGLSLRVSAGEHVGISGPNGSGKTTLSRTVATLVPLRSGTGRVLGADLAGRDLRSARESISYLGHQPALITSISLAQNLRHFCRLAQLDEARIRHALEVVGLAEAGDVTASGASFGMQRRTEIALALLRRPKLLLLDEAGSGLDDSATGLISGLITSVIGRDGAVVTVSHDHDFLDKVSDSRYELQSGRLESLT